MLAKLFQVAFAGLLLAGCAMTPQQRAAYEAAREREMKQTAVALAAQCDRRTAELLALQQEDYLGVADAEKPKLQREYRRRIAEPSFSGLLSDGLGEFGVSAAAGNVGAARAAA